MIGGATRAGIRKGVMLGESISHEWASSRNYLDGRKCPEEAQGCRVM